MIYHVISPGEVARREDEACSCLAVDWAASRCRPVLAVLYSLYEPS